MTTHKNSVANVRALPRRLALLAGSALIVAGSGNAAYASQAIATANASPAHDPIVSSGESVSIVAQNQVRLATVTGTFGYVQGEVDGLDRVARTFGDAASYLCDSQYAPAQAGDALAWEIAVAGDVDEGFVAPLGDLAEDGAVNVVMGCSCSGNPIDGRASVNAQVTGVTIATLMERAGVAQDANTIVFTSADGYEVALPLSYVAQRHSVIAYAINGAELADSIGGSNQLWLGSTSARYFARDIVSVRFETRQTPPPAPGAQDAQEANVPNAAIVSAA